MNRNLKEEKSFPLVLLANYNDVIKPRGDLLKDSVKHFKLEEAFLHTDKKFCRYWGIEPEKLADAKKSRTRVNKAEREVLWRYVDVLK